MLSMTEEMQKVVAGGEKKNPNEGYCSQAAQGTGAVSGEHVCTVITRGAGAAVPAVLVLARLQDIHSWSRAVILCEKLFLQKSEVFEMLFFL